MASASALPPALLRLTRATPLDDAELAVLRAALDVPRQVRARRLIAREDWQDGRPSLVVAGWAAPMCVLPDGRRQLLGLLLPGDLVGLHRQRPPPPVELVALTDVVLATLPPPGAAPGLAEAYAAAAARAEAQLLAQLARLGRLDAAERIADLMHDLRGRLDLAGLVEDGAFELPLTQDMLADVLGLTSVHINRTLRQMRRDGLLHWQEGRLTLPAALRT